MRENECSYYDTAEKEHIQVIACNIDVIQHLTRSKWYWTMNEALREPESGNLQLCVTFSPDIQD
jgi:hypothetical protein